MSDIHILIVEDEKEIADVLGDYMHNEGYRASMLYTGEEVVSFVKKERPSLILLDLMLPEVDGKSICKGIRKFSKVPIIMITAKVDEIDRIIGLELGADDYVCKPFSPREVVARVNAVLRRTQPSETSEIFYKERKKSENEINKGIVEEGQSFPECIAADPLQLNLESRQLLIHHQEITLTPSEFDILSVLMKRPGRVYTRTQLIETVQGYQFEGYERTIDFHIKNIRKKISVCLPGQKMIQAVYGTGYKLII